LLTFDLMCAPLSGHGEPTTNAKSFYDWLMSPDRNKCVELTTLTCLCMLTVLILCDLCIILHCCSHRELFNGVHYTVFGLGQSKQHPENYQSIGRAIDARLEGWHLVQHLLHVCPGADDAA